MTSLLAAHYTPLVYALPHPWSFIRNPSRLCQIAHLHECTFAILCIYYNLGSPVSTVRAARKRGKRIAWELAPGSRGGSVPNG